MLAGILLSQLVFAQAGKQEPRQGPPDETELVFAEEPSPQDGEEMQPISNFGVWDFVRMLFILGIVLAFLFGFFHYLKRLSAPKDGGLEIIRLLESKALTTSKHLHLIEVGEHVVLIGTAENSIQLLLELRDKETLDTLRLRVSELPTRKTPKHFFDLVRKYFAKKEGATIGEDSLDFIRKQRERLNKLH